MRASQWLLGLATATAILGAVGSVGTGCGGSSTSGGGGKDSGSDVTAVDTGAPDTGTKEAAAETGPKDAAPEAAACVPVDADLTTFPIPDSGLPDAGIDIAACVDCLRSNCHNELEQCNGDCICIDAIAGCLASGGINLACIPSGASQDPAILALGACVFGSCQSACIPATGGKDGGGDGGGTEGGTPTDGGDAGDQ